MTAEILSIGTELLLGRVVNTNAAFLAQGLAELGIGSYWQTVVGDNPQRLQQAISTALSRSDMVIMTGGLGPTYDDMTKEIVARHFSLSLELHPPSYQKLTQRFAAMDRPMTENNKKQAFMPKGATVFDNDRGTAPGLAVEQNGKIALLLPGPPVEMQAMFDQQVVPYLMKYTDMVFRSHAIHFFGIGESQLEQDLHEYMLRQTNPSVATYASQNEVRIQVTASGSTPGEAEALLSPVVERIVSQYPEYVYGVDVGNLQNALVMELLQSGHTIATAESCTGGLVSQRITDVSGASAVFGYGVCTYANQAKQDLLGVPAKTLEQWGAVSPQTAKAMAEGVRRLSGADIGISTTGIAGPTGGTPEKPVGLVYVGVSTSKETVAHKLMLARGYGGERERIRFVASSHALHFALQTVRSFKESDR